ncbi:hypothetical protein C2845_PM06G25010 [Panicum miliaceum]|uniref:Uncharacterized protein n=1 Tax=Panicum miliaceum TaxID=4540 RepID=A0A3L6RFW9_PANMI|nr:hypothetical protein C2845_PM06G25010 [Panicum miliaceum]
MNLDQACYLGLATRRGRAPAVFGEGEGEGGQRQSEKGKGSAAVWGGGDRQRSEEEKEVGDGRGRRPAVRREMGRRRVGLGAPPTGCCGGLGEMGRWREGDAAASPCPKEVVGEASSSQPAENESGSCGNVSFDQLEIREEGGTQREEIDVDGVADGEESVQGIVEDLEAVDRNAIEEEENLTMEDDTYDEYDNEEDNMATQAPVLEEWNRPDASSMEAMDMHGSRWGIMTSNLAEANLNHNRDLRPVVNNRHWEREEAERERRRRYHDGYGPPANQGNKGRHTTTSSDHLGLPHKHPPSTTTTSATTSMASPPSPTGFEGCYPLLPPRAAQHRALAQDVREQPQDGLRDDGECNKHADMEDAKKTHHQQKDRRTSDDSPNHHSDDLHGRRNDGRPARLNSNKNHDRPKSSKNQDRKHGPENTVAIADRPQQRSSLNQEDLDQLLDGKCPWHKDANHTV